LFCELAGVEIPEKVEGQSLVSIMQDKTEYARRMKENFVEPAEERTSSSGN